MMDLYEQLRTQASRRSFLGRSALGIGSMALASLLNPVRASASAIANVGSPQPFLGTVNPRHFAPKAKRVIYLYMAGGPSHLETLDFKPKLAEMSGKPMPESFTKGQPIAQLQNQAL